MHVFVTVFVEVEVTVDDRSIVVVLVVVLVEPVSKIVVGVPGIFFVSVDVWTRASPVVISVTVRVSNTVV